MTFSLIAACDQERGIGKAGVLPWRLPKELEHFHQVTAETRDTTKRNAVIMGRKTWESIPEGRRPLAGRLNCVITRDGGYALPEGAQKFSSLEDCLSSLEKDTTVEYIFIIGGGELFRQAIAMPACDMIYLTEIESVFGCDTFFPPLPKEFRKEQESEMQEENEVRYKFVTYKRQ
ncbi:MAG: dihydrofolate reductase [Patescibacteria group bacterium]